MTVLSSAKSESNASFPARRIATKVQPSSSRLTVVSARRLQARAQRRRSHVILVLAGSFLVAALLVVVAGQALVASQQVRLDNLEQQLASAVSTNANLELQRAELAAPARVLQLAERKLDMVSPKNVTYLVPVDPGPPLSAGNAAPRT